MRTLKNSLKRLVGKFGYRLHRASGECVSFENFANMVRAYELRLGERGIKLEENQMRTRLLARLLGTPPSEAFHIIQSLAETESLEGDVCEFGVAQGGTSALIANEIKCGERKLHLFDSFEGLPSPTEKDQLKDDIYGLGSIESYTGAMAFSEDLVRGRLDAISFPKDRVVIHRGFISQTIKEDPDLPAKVSLAYVDFDFYEPILETLVFLERVLVEGAVVIVDDYDFFSTGAKTAVDEFLEAMRMNGSGYTIEVPDIRYGHFALIRRGRR